MHRNNGTGFGWRIKRARIDQGLTQEELIERMERLAGAGLSRSYISALENGEKVPGGEVVRTLALALGVTADYLLGLSDDPRRAEELEIVAIWQVLDERRRAELLDLAYAIQHTASAVARGRLAETQRALLSIEEQGGPEARRLAETLMR